MHEKIKVVILADVPGWAYHRRAVALQKYAPDDFDVTVEYTCDLGRIVRGKNVELAEHLAEYDLVFQLDYMSRWVGRTFYRNGLLRKVPLVVSHNRDSKSLLELWGHSYEPAMRHGYLICNNLEVFETNGRLPRTCCISNGYDTDLWDIDVPIMKRPKKVIWCGGANPRKRKGYQDILKPIVQPLRDRGWKTDFRAYEGGDLQDWAFSQEKQREWYNSASVVICASEHEGTPNFTGEAMLCGCVNVSTHVGNVREYGVDKVNCVIAERTPEAMLEACEYAWEHRERIAQAGVMTMVANWSYGPPGERGQYYFQLFRRLLTDGAETIEPFSYHEKHWSEI